MNRFLVKQRVGKLAESLTELKVKVRAALAGELASAVGSAVRDVLVIALLDRMMAVPRPSTMSRSAGSWRDDEFEDRDRDRWDERDPWSERDDYGTHHGAHKREEREEDEDVEPSRAVPAVAAVAVGVNVGRWWLARKGSTAAALGLGAVATALGVSGGPLALAVIAAATDLLSAESALVGS